MKIERIDTTAVCVPLVPERIIVGGKGKHGESPFLIVKVHTDDGHVGLGEVSCTPKWSGEDQVSAAHFINANLAPELVGSDPRDVTALTRVMDIALAGNVFTKAGVEMALWDLLGKAAGLPVHRLLGGPVRNTVTTKFSISGIAPDKAAALGRWAVDSGFAAMKVKVGTTAEQDVARVAAVREAVGPDIKLGVDANGGWSRATAIRTIRELERYNIAFAEQPIAPGDVNQLADVRSAIGVPLLADESVFSVADAMAVIRADAADALSIYVGKAGGIGPARQIALVAHAAGVPCTVGSNLELGIASAAMAHLATATPGIDAESLPCDIIGPHYYADTIVAEGCDIQPGVVHVPDRPGLGVTLDDDKLSRYAVPLK